MRIIFVFLLASYGLNSWGQQYPFHKHYDLGEASTYATNNETKQLYYYTKYLMTIEYDYIPYVGHVKYKTKHYRVKLNADVAIEEFNKVYIPMENAYGIMKVEARVIKPNEVIDVDVDLEQFYSEEEGENYQYFPISGLELGDEVEIFYSLRMAPSYNGEQFLFQGEMPIYDFDFRLIAPNDTYFNLLSQNGLPEPQLQDTILQKNEYWIHLDTIPALKSEYFSEYNNVCMRLDASLSSIKGTVDETYSPYDSYSSYAKRAFAYSLSKKDLKALEQLSNRLGVSRLNKEIDNIRKIENYMKNDFLVGYGERDLSIHEIIEQGKSDGIGAMNLFMRLLSFVGIEFEFGLVSDRYDSYFSDEIESDKFMQNYFIYFPRIDEYLAPLDFGSRLGYLDHDWTPNNGLFFKMEKNYLNDKLEGTIKPIKTTPSTANSDSTVVVINVHDDYGSADITIERYIKGFKAGEHQVYYQVYNKQKKEEVHDELLDIFKNNSRYELKEIKHANSADAFHKPLIVKGTVTSMHAPLFERANKMFILDFGVFFKEYVDPKELDRKQFDFVFAHALVRSKEIQINFPNDVNLLNTDAIPVFDDLVDIESIQISSNLKLEKNKMIYKVRDEYKQQRYPVDLKQDIIKVFDFHDELTKVKLLIEEQ